VAEPCASEGVRGAPSGVGVWGQPGTTLPAWNHLFLLALSRQGGEAPDGTSDHGTPAVRRRRGRLLHAHLWPSPLSPPLPAGKGATAVGSRLRAAA